MTQHYLGISKEVLNNLLKGHFFSQVDLDSSSSVKKNNGFITYNSAEGKYVIEDSRLDIEIPLPEYIFSDGIAQNAECAAKDVAFQLNKLFSIVSTVVTNSIRDNIMNKQRCLTEIAAKINEYDSDKSARFSVIKELQLKKGSLVNVNSKGQSVQYKVDNINFDFTIRAVRGEGTAIAVVLNDLDPISLKNKSKAKIADIPNNDLFAAPAFQQSNEPDSNISTASKIPNSEIDEIFEKIKSFDIGEAINSKRLLLNFDVYPDIGLGVSLYFDGEFKDKYFGGQYGNEPKMLFREIVESGAWRNILSNFYHLSSQQLQALKGINQDNELNHNGRFFSDIPGLNNFILLQNVTQENITLISPEGECVEVGAGSQLDRLNTIIEKVKLSGNLGRLLNNCSAISIEDVDEFRVSHNESQLLSM